MHAQKYLFTRQDISILMGGLLDYFHIGLYGFIAPLIAPLFFPKFDVVVQLILTYGMLISSTFSMPLGSIIFGYFARKKGPVFSLVTSLIGLSLSTVLLGLVPTYTQIGVGAPLLFMLLLALRGLFSSGEGAIARLYLLENKTTKEMMSASYLYQGIIMIGIILASFIVTKLSSVSDIKQYWRIPFFMGGVVGLVALYLRLSAKHYVHLKLSQPENFKLLWKKIKQTKLILFRIAIVAAFSHMTYLIPFVFMNSFVPLISGFSFHEMMKLNTSLLIFDTVAILVIGFFIKHFNVNKILFFVSLIVLLTAFPLFWYLKNASLSYIVFVRLWIVILGVAFVCPLNVWLNQQFFEDADKYFLVGLGYSMGAAAVGHWIVPVSLFLWQQIKQPYAPALLICIISFLTMISIYPKRVAKEH